MPAVPRAASASASKIPPARPGVILPCPLNIVAHPSANQSFPRQLRLTRHREFEQVLRRPDARLKAGPLRLNLVFNRMHHARLGLIVGKKAVARASARNRIKRVIRDRFRKAQNELPAVDMVVRVIGPVSRAHLHRYLDRLLAELETLADTARP